MAGAFERYCKAVDPRRVVGMLAGRKEFSRQGPLSAWVVIWLMIFQRLDAQGTLAVAVRELLCGGVREWVRWRRGKRRELSASTSAYSQARRRLPLELAEEVSDMIFDFALGEPAVLPGLQQPMFLLDGSTLLLPHSDDLTRAYPPPRNQHGASHWATIRVLVAHEVASALAVRPCWGPMDGDKAVSEQGLAKQMLPRLPARSVVLGDRNFGVFSVAYHAQQGQHPCLLRLTEARARKVNGGSLPNAGSDKTIRWECSRADQRSNPEIPKRATLQGRLVAIKVFAADGKPQKVYLFTTLDLPAQRLAELYGYRWNIETDLRSLKREVRLHMLTAQSKEMVDKELVLGVAAYNLTRAAISAAAAALHLSPRQFSFSLARDTIRAFMPRFAEARSDAERKQIGEQMMRVMSQSLLPRRRKRRPSAPREVWPRPCPFPRRKVSKTVKPVPEAKVAEK